MFFKCSFTVLVICVYLKNFSVLGNSNLRDKRTPQNQLWNDSFLSQNPDDIAEQLLIWNKNLVRNSSPSEGRSIEFHHTVTSRQTNENHYDTQRYIPTYNGNPMRKSTFEMEHAPYFFNSRGLTGPPLPPPTPNHLWSPPENKWRPPPPPQEAKRSPQGPPYMIQGPAPPPQYIRNSFDNRGPPFDRGPPFEQQPPAHRGPPGQDQYWIPPGHRNRPGNGNRQDGYNFLSEPEMTNHIIPNGSPTTDKNLQYDSSTIISRPLEQTTKNLIYAVTESSPDTITEKDNVKITYDAGRAIAVINGNSNAGSKIVPVTLIFQVQPVTPAS